jgi:transposase
MSKLTTIGLDLAKNVFHVVGVDAHGKRVLRKQLRRAQVLSYFSQLAPCRVGMEACAGAHYHYWGRELEAPGSAVCGAQERGAAGSPGPAPAALTLCG